jgi:hypothetical protein
MLRDFLNRSLLLILFIAGCLYSQDRTVLKAFPPPEGYTRITCDSASFSYWLQRLPLKSDNTILTYNGDRVQRGFYNTWGVLDMPLLFSSDLEQCADYCMRLWAEYHRAYNSFDKLYLFNYSGKRTYFNNSNRTFRSFLKQAFAYSNSYSLKKGCKPVADTALIPGDLFIQNQTGGVGHVSMILDICESASGEKLYLIGYSFMPAQEFHIEKADECQKENRGKEDI